LTEIGEQTSVRDAGKKPQMKRSSAQRMGKFRWLNYRMDRVEQRQRKIMRMLQVITNSLEPFIQVDNREFLGIICKDEVDEALVEYLGVRGGGGLTPGEACAPDELLSYRLKAYQVTRRIQGMNVRLRKWLGKDVAVSLRRRWQLSRFAEKMFGDAEDDGDAEDEEVSEEDVED